MALQDLAHFDGAPQEVQVPAQGDQGVMAPDQELARVQLGSQGRQQLTVARLPGGHALCHYCRRVQELQGSP